MQIKTQPHLIAPLKARKTVDQMKADKILADWEGTNWAITSDQFLEVLARDLAQK